MTDSLYENFGGLTLPADIGSDLQATSLDPAREVLTGLFKQALISELGTAWSQVTTALGGRWAGTQPVETTLEIQPTAQTLVECKTGLPLLCLFRQGTVTFENQSVNVDKMIQEWGLLWVLGQADSIEKRKLFDFIQAGVKVLRLVIEKRGHPDYDGGALQLFSDTGALGSLVLNSANFEPRTLTDKDPTEWLMLEATLTSEEYSSINLGQYADITTIEASIGVGSEDGILPDLINIDTRYGGV